MKSSLPSPVLSFPNAPVALPVTVPQLLALGVPQSAIDAGEMRGEIKTFGPWHIPISYKALAISCVWREEGYSRPKDVTVYGLRTLSKPNSSGHELEGKVSLNGQRWRAFTSSQLFELPDKRLVNVATVHVCIGQK